MSRSYTRNDTSHDTAIFADYVFFETSSTAPYQIRRIEELIKTPNGNVEAKVMCFYRRRDISSNLISLADKHQSAVEEQEKAKDNNGSIKDCKDGKDGANRDKEKDFGGSPKEAVALTKEKDASGPKTLASLSDKERHQLKHRELFLSRQVETLPATAIRGKCHVTLLNETETLVSYLNKDDAFFYSLVYDPGQKTLLADKGEIRVGSKYQAEISPWVPPASRPPSPIIAAPRETLVFSPYHQLDDKTIDQFLVICRSVGTFARALDCSSSVKQPSLHMSAAAASRDVTLFHAMDALHRYNYDVSKALCSLVPQGGPVLCRDEMEEWSASEANLFEEALEKYGKDFNDIRADFLPWKSLKSIVEYYYMWKTTDRYVQQKRVKAVEAEFKLKQVYIPNYNKNEASMGANAVGRPCESCYATTCTQWFSWGLAHMQCRLCASCWPYWKRYGGLKFPTRMEAVGSVDLSTAGAAATTHNGTAASSGNTPSLSIPVPSVAPSATRPPVSALAGLPAPNPGVAPLGAAANLALVQQLATMKDGPCRCPMCGKELKQKTHLVRHCITNHGLNMSLPPAAAGVSVAAATATTSQGVSLPLSLMRSSSPRPIVKTRAAFYLHTTPQTKQLRRQCKSIIKPRHAARNPFSPVDLAAIRVEMQTKPLTGVVPKRMKNRGRVVDISHRLGTPPTPKPDFLLTTPPDKRPAPLPEAFPRKASLKRAAVQDEAIAAKRLALLQAEVAIGPSAGQASNPTATPGVAALLAGVSVAPSSASLPASAPSSTSTGKPTRKHMGTWCPAQGDAPDDLFFKATPATRRLRKSCLTVQQIRRFARRATKYRFNMNKP
ncbi:metastasis-associated protein MTA1-like [Tropilaelaps mercedesae]|uniref:Metastasis-associated protein MTA1-like n=1 Tax=Tropilaelaps mercedesae TaxID=418985 RepID=A0A1V9XN05_9ACAR|nr:metastasis-associated protein MTA1-like [Tropilaelaps mercedesae]